MTTPLDELEDYTYFSGTELRVPTQFTGVLRCECGTTIEITEMFFHLDKNIQIGLRTGCSKLQCSIYKGRTKVTIYTLEEIVKINENQSVYEKLVDYKGIGDKMAKKLITSQYNTIKKIQNSSEEDLMRNVGLTEGQAKLIITAINSN